MREENRQEGSYLLNYVWPSNDALRDYLRGLGLEELVNMIMGEIPYNDRLREVLRMKAAVKPCGAVTVENFLVALHRVLEAAFSRPPFEATRNIDHVIDCFEELVEQKGAEECVKLAEQFFMMIDEASQAANVFYRPFLERVEALHLRACIISRPDPISLAERLFCLELGAKREGFQGAIMRYADILGESGVAHYRGLAEKVWAQVPSILPNGPRRLTSPKRRKIALIMEMLAYVSGDYAELAAVKSRYLPCPFSFLEVAQLYKQAGREDESLEWAERGIDAFPNQQVSELREFLVGEYERRGRHHDALSQIWSLFCDKPTIETYQLLRRHVEETEQWPLWRARAIEQIRACYSAARRTTRRKKLGPEYPGHFLGYRHSLLVEIFLLENDPDAAWREAKENGCSIGLWQRLADVRAETQPGEVISFFQQVVECVLKQKDGEWYGEAAVLIRKIGDCMHKQAQTKEFTAYVKEVRTRQKRRRNLMGCLDRQLVDN